MSVPARYNNICSTFMKQMIFYCEMKNITNLLKISTQGIRQLLLHFDTRYFTLYLTLLNFVINANYR